MPVAEVFPSPPTKVYLKRISEVFSSYCATLGVFFEGVEAVSERCFADGRTQPFRHYFVTGALTKPNVPSMRFLVVCEYHSREM